MTHCLSSEDLCNMILNRETVDDCRGSRPFLPPAEEIRRHHRNFRFLQEIFIAQPIMCVIPKITYPSKSPFSELTRVELADLVLGIPTIGKYLLLRIIEPGYVSDTWHTVVEDHVGNACYLSLYNYPEDELLSVGSVIILKEPYFDKEKSEKEFLRSDCPTDIIVLRKSSHLYGLAENIVWKNAIIEVADPLFTPPVPYTPKMWKARGKALYREQQYILANEAFALGLRLCKETDNVWRHLQLNLSGVLHVLGYYEKSLVSADKVLRLYPNDVKGLLWVGKCYYIFRDYQLALEMFGKAHNVDEHNDEVRVELMKTQQRIKEQETGDVSIVKLELKCLMSPMTKIEIADYVGPVMVTDVCEKDRGLVATRDVAAGELLMISKAISSAFVQDKISNLYYDIKHNGILPKHFKNVVTEVAHLIARNPNTYGALIYNLSAGSIPRERVDVFCDPDTKQEPISDVGKINDICQYNAIPICNVFTRTIEGSGLFILPSFLNHSCVPNAKFVTYNDVMLVHAVKKIKAGDEVCISYVPLDLPAESQKELLKKKQVICLCPKCKTDPMKSNTEKKIS